jgi:hypothetical protein
MFELKVLELQNERTASTSAMEINKEKNNIPVSKAEEMPPKKSDAKPQHSHKSKKHEPISSFEQSFNFLKTINLENHSQNFQRIPKKTDHKPVNLLLAFYLEKLKAD